MPLAPGTKAPDFTLKTRFGGEMKDVTLSDNFGKNNTVLLFFPAAFTGACTSEMCGVSGRMSDYGALDAKVYGISVDSAFSQEAWANKENITFPLLSDYKREVAKAYDVLWPDLAGMGPSAARAVFVIDKDGIIRYSEQTPVPSDLPDFQKVDAALRELGPAVGR